MGELQVYSLLIWTDTDIDHQPVATSMMIPGSAAQLMPLFCQVFVPLRRESQQMLCSVRTQWPLSCFPLIGWDIVSVRCDKNLFQIVLIPPGSSLFTPGKIYDCMMIYRIYPRPSMGQAYSPTLGWFQGSCRQSQPVSTMQNPRVC